MQKFKVKKFFCQKMADLQFSSLGMIGFLTFFFSGCQLKSEASDTSLSGRKQNGEPSPTSQRPRRSFGQLNGRSHLGCGRQMPNYPGSTYSNAAEVPSDQPPKPGPDRAIVHTRVCFQLAVQFGRRSIWQICTNLQSYCASGCSPHNGMHTQWRSLFFD